MKTLEHTTVLSEQRLSGRCEPAGASEAIKNQPAYAGRSDVWRDCLLLAKPRISLMVLITVAAGFLMASAGSPDWLLLVHALVGTLLVAAGTNALNQLLERDTDVLMERTKDRPIPSGRLTPQAALRFGVLSAVAGFVYLSALVNPLTGLLGVVTLAIYVFLYTPLKRRTTFNTLIGAIPGAMPPVMGWAAATGSITVEAGAMFLILFTWQFPHFWAIAWMYREDYARAGIRVVPVFDRQGGRMTGRLMVQHAVVLVLASLAPVFLAMAGRNYFWGALFLGATFLAFTVRFLLAPSRERARHVLWASLVYLPLLFGLMLLDGPWLI